MSQIDFRGRRAILYYGLFKPKAPYDIGDDTFVVPSGWQMVSMGSGALLRMCRQHFVAPADWSDELVWKRFREWLIFDSFVMQNSHAARLFDENFPLMEDVINQFINKVRLSGIFERRLLVEGGDFFGAFL